MSSVGSSDGSSRSSADDTIRRDREDYRKKEAELVKKQTKEVRRLNENHYAESERVKQEHQDQMTDLHKQAKEEISERDHRYQQDIEGMRDLHRKEIQRIADENQRKEDSLRQATSADQHSMKKFNDDRYEKLTKDYNQKSTEMGEHYEEASKQARDAQAEALNTSRDKLEKEHQKQLRSVTDNRNQKIGQLERDFSDYRKFTAKERQDGEIHHLQEAHRNSDNLMRAVGRERAAREDGEAVLRQGFDSALQDTRDRYDKARKNERDAIDSSEANMKSLAVDRIDGQVRRLQNEKRDLQDNNVRAETKMEFAKRQEIKNVQESYQKNVDNYKEQRDEAIRQGNESNAKDLAKVRGDLEQQMVESGRYYRDQANTQNRIFRTAYDNMKGDYEARHEQTKNLTDARVKHILDDTNETKERLINLQNEEHMTSQRTKADELKNLRDSLGDEKQQAVNRLQDQMRKLEVDHADRMQNVVGKYEKQIQVMKDQMLRERKMNDENTKRLTDELARVHKMEVDQVEAKNREKVRILGQQHSEEVRQLNKRHEEKLDQVIGEMKKT
jgi:hypothetical protein